MPVQDGRAVTFGERAGLYRLASGTDESRVVTEFAANLDDLDESRILPQKTLKIAGQVSAPPPVIGAVTAACDASSGSGCWSSRSGSRWRSG